MYSERKHVSVEKHRLLFSATMDYQGLYLTSHHKKLENWTKYVKQLLWETGNAGL